ncbi:tRNA uridine-5-carboxymethylaminomethyl(34) synthesis GTPase MnmE [Lentisphaerota bacterium WC36G]|nr:tRNA uridine-5-carboxymethylaminomethyl(34) synthesis GTPase MnmE [Lentisphaerae bacterium WC36]
MNTDDTIAALCTGVGGAINIIRISGEQAFDIGQKVWEGSKFLKENPRVMLFGRVALGENSYDQALAVGMPNPHSYTGEDVVELHCHGGSLVAGKVLEMCVKNGARSAEGGEFTYRAFLNDKMDLTQAEAVQDIISAHSKMALSLAEKQISGQLGVKVSEIRLQLFELLAEIESRMDFPEENLDWVAPKIINEKIDSTVEDISKLLSSRTEGAVLRDGVKVVIAGRPNAGKSSLLNLLLGFDRAIVTQLAGTTRDTLEEFATIRNIPVNLVDTAGIRDADNIIEQIGIDRSRKSLDTAHLIFWLLDASSDYEAELKEMENHLDADAPVIVIWNKIDELARLNKTVDDLPETPFSTVKISVVENKNIDNLLDLFEEKVWGYPHNTEPDLAVSSRHSALLDEALVALAELPELVSAEDWELSAVNLHSAVMSLGTITGEDASIDVLENIFSNFCIGK